MRIFRVLTVLAGLLPVPALAAPLQWSDKTVVIGISVDSSGLVALAAFLTEIDGKLAVCGATWMDKDSATARPHRSKLLRALMVSADGRILPFSAQSFPVYLTAEEAQQGGPKCVKTKKPWADSYAKAKVELKLRTHSSAGM